MSTATEYRYPHFRRELIREDSHFVTGPSPGESFPDFDLATTEGYRVNKAQFAGQLFLMTFASYT